MFAEQSQKQLELFEAHLPRRPWCADDYRFGVKVRAAMEAVRFRYVQPNPPWLKRWIVFDADYDGAAIGWRYLDAPAPNIVAENRENGHAHLFYGLDVPVHVDPEKARKAVRFCAAVEYALLVKLHADPAYCGLLAKNPLSDAWRVDCFEEFAYDLATLAEGLELAKWEDGRRRLPDYGIGRNCTLFDLTRRYAYKAVRQYWGKSFSAFAEDLLVHVAFANNQQFGESGLHYSEFRHIARSVAKWTWRHFTPEAFSQIQAARRAKINAQRRAEADERAQQLFAFMAEHPDATQAEAAAILGVTDRTVRNYQKRKHPISRYSGLLSPADPVLFSGNDSLEERELGEGASADRRQGERSE